MSLLVFLFERIRCLLLVVGQLIAIAREQFSIFVLAACGGSNYYCTGGARKTASPGYYTTGGTATTRTGQTGMVCGCSVVMMSFCAIPWILDLSIFSLYETIVLVLFDLIRRLNFSIVFA